MSYYGNQRLIESRAEVTVTVSQGYIESTSGLNVTEQKSAAVGSRKAEIQYLRGFAAVAVVLTHLTLGDERFGVYGVSVFFAISGYLMSTLARSDDPWRFLSHRIVRIYPTFFLMVGFAFLLKIAVDTPFSFDLLGLSLMPVGGRSNSLGGIEWTLVFEITYYTLLFFLMLFKRQRSLDAIAAVWLAVILGATFLLPSVSEALQFPLNLLLVPANVAFAGGLLVPALLARGYLPAVSAVLIVPFVFAYGLFDLDTNRCLSGLAATCLVGWAAQAKVGREASPIRPLLTLGEWSYALYLCHVPVIRAVNAVWPDWLAPWGAAWLGLAASLVAASIFGPIDVALYRKGRQWVDHAPPRRTRLTISVFVLAFLGVTTYGSVTSVLDTIQNRNVRNTLNQLGRPALRSPEAATARVAELGIGLASSFRGAFERIDHVADGRAVLRGWAFDGQDLSDAIMVRAFCRGRGIPVERVSRRLRPDVAETLGRQDLATRRFGFTLLVQESGCSKGSQVFVVAFDRLGHAGVLPGLVEW
jgi:exopolysaccharide production protein ExoZ